MMMKNIPLRPKSSVASLVVSALGAYVLCDLVKGECVHGQEYGWITGLFVATGAATLAFLSGMAGMVARKEGRMVAVTALGVAVAEIVVVAWLWWRATT